MSALHLQTYPHLSMYMLYVNMTLPMKFISCVSCVLVTL